MSTAMQLIVSRQDVQQLDRGETVEFDFSNERMRGGSPVMPTRVRIVPEGPGFQPPTQFKPCSTCDRPALCQTILAGTQPCVHPLAPEHR